MSNKTHTLDFESAMTELETLIAKIEQGDLSLETSLKDFEKGIALTRACQSSLKDAEQRVKLLTDGLSEDMSSGSEVDFLVDEQ